MQLPLQGYTIVELGSALAGPYCCRILGDMGARIIKVEPPGGDPARAWGKPVQGNASALFHAINKEKDSIVVDFNNPDDVERLKDIIATRADAVVQNLRPGVAEKTGIGAEECRAMNPGLVYCNISAFGSKGPLASAPGYEALLQAFSGIMEVTGDADGGPARVGFSVNDLGTAMWAAIGVLTALLARSRTGEGCIVDAAMLDTALAWQTLGVAALMSTGQAPQRTGMKGTMVSPNRAFECSDGLILLTVGTNTQFEKLCRTLGCSELAADPRFATNNDRVEHDDALAKELEQRFRTRPRNDWWALLQDAGVPAAPVNTLEEAVAHEQARASGILQEGPDDTPKLVGLPLVFDGERPAYRRTAPALGCSTGDIMKNNGSNGRGNRNDEQLGNSNQQGRQ